MVQVAPSLLAVWEASGGDYEACAATVKEMRDAGAALVHVDVMDGVYVPAKTFGSEMVARLKSVTSLPLDVHLMVNRPEEVLQDYLAAGSDRVVFHPSASKDVAGCLQRLAEAGITGGLALDADEGVEEIEKLPTQVRKQIRQVLVMTVKAGAGGQSFRPELLDKARQVREVLGNRVILGVDGGVNATTASAVRAVGVDFMVAGSFLFKGEGSMARKIAQLRSEPVRFPEVA